jgi:Dolichyl-phosphate-mannose-protein mannosyltransferase
VSPPPARYTEFLESQRQIVPTTTLGLFLLIAAVLIAAHAPLLRLPYFWDEAGYYIPAARDVLSGSLIPYSTPSNAHPPLVLAWLALSWKVFGYNTITTRCAMLLLAAFSLVGFFRLARTVSNTTVAIASTLLTAIYPVWFAQSSLALIDLPAAGLLFWGLEAHLRRHRTLSAFWFALAALAKETAILMPIALLCWELLAQRLRRLRLNHRLSSRGILALLFPLASLALWYAYHFARTGHVFGNAEFFRYNVQATLHPLRIFLALLLRLWQTFGYLNLYLLTLACILAMRQPAIEENTGPRPRINPYIQFSFLAIAAIYLLALSVIGGAVLARYILPIIPLVILVCVSTIWRRLRLWKAVLAIAGGAFVAALFINPPYGFSPEDNLAYGDYIRMHERACTFLQHRYPRARVLTAWPASDELTHPYLGYVGSTFRVVRIEDFSLEQVTGAASLTSQFDAAFLFSTKFEPPYSFFDRWKRWQKWKSRYFGYHRDLPPEAAAALLGGNVLYRESRRGQWVGVIELQKIEQAQMEASAGH